MSQIKKTFNSNGFGAQLMPKSIPKIVYSGLNYFKKNLLGQFIIRGPWRAPPKQNLPQKLLQRLANGSTEMYKTYFDRLRHF